MVIVPGPPIVVPPPTQPVDCPPLSYADRLALYGLQFRQQQSQGVIIPEVLSPTAQADVMPLSVGTGTLVEATDSFRFRAISTADNVPVTFFGRVMLKNGSIVPFSRTLSTTAPNTLYEATGLTGEGMLLGASASVPVGSITTGAVNAIAEVGRLTGSTFTPHTVLFSGQLDDQQALSSTIANPTTPVDRPTFTVATTSGTFAQEITMTITPATGRRVRVLTVSATYTPSAVVQERYVQLRFRVSGATVWFNYPSFFTRASQPGLMRGSMGGQNIGVFDVDPVVTDAANVSIPETLYFYQAFVVSVRFINNIAGDTCSDMSVSWEET